MTIKRYGNIPTPKRMAQPRQIHQPPSSKTIYTATGQHQFTENNIAQFAQENGLGYYEQTGDAVTRNDRKTLVSLERQLDDQNMFYSAIKDRMVSNLVGPDGFTLQARTGNDNINQFIETELWPAFTSSPEYRDLFSWKDCQYLAMREMIGPGDVGFIKLLSGQLQAIENEWIDEPYGDQSKVITPNEKIEQGIAMLIAGGKVTGFWVTQPSTYGYTKQSNGRKIDKKNFIFCHGKAQRSSRSRSIPPFIQVASSLWRLDDILNSEAVCWQLLAKHAMVINQDDATSNAYDLSVDDTASAGPPQPPITDRVTEHDTATIFWGNQGETISGIDRNLPGKDFPASVRAFIQVFAMRYGLPLEILMLDWSKTNFSSGKAALTQATQMIREWQVRLVEQFHQQVYEWKVRQWVAESVLPSFADVANHEWFPPILPWVDPTDEAESWGIQIDRGLVTYSNALKQNGKDRDTQNAERAKDIQSAMDHANALMEANEGQFVSWKLFAGYAEGKTEAAMTAGGRVGGEVADDSSLEGVAKARELAEIAQKVYLARGPILDAGEVRGIMNKAGADLSEQVPDDVKNHQPKAGR